MPAWTKEFMVKAERSERFGFVFEGGLDLVFELLTGGGVID